MLLLLVLVDDTAYFTEELFLLEECVFVICASGDELISVEKIYLHVDVFA